MPRKIEGGSPTIHQPQSYRIPNGFGKHSSTYEKPNNMETRVGKMAQERHKERKEGY